jgi:hypothetical protein
MISARLSCISWMEMDMDLIRNDHEGRWQLTCLGRPAGVSISFNAAMAPQVQLMPGLFCILSDIWDAMTAIGHDPSDL